MAKYPRYPRGLRCVISCSLFDPSVLARQQGTTWIVSPTTGINPYSSAPITVAALSMKRRCFIGFQVANYLVTPCLERGIGGGNSSTTGSLFSVGDDWSKIYEVLPEVIAYRNDRRLNSDMRAVLRSAKRSVSKDPWIEKLEKLERDVQAAVQSRSRNTLIIFDQVFFDTCDLTQEQIYAMEEEEGEMGALLVFLDRKGNQIRASRVSQDILDVLEVSYFYLNTAELACWEYGIVGEKYKPGGEIGRQYYGPQGTEWTTEPADTDIPQSRTKAPQ